MSLKHRKYCMYAVMALTLLAALLANFTAGTTQRVFIGATVVMIVAMVTLWLALWRCPNCHRFLTGLNVAKCPHCGRNLRK